MIFKIAFVISLCSIICANSHPSLKDVLDFKWLTGEPYFIDKTEMLTLIFDDDNTTTSNISHHFISCPFHFAKRKNLYMIKEFAEIEVDKNGNPKLWLGTEALDVFQHLKIGHHPHVISKHLARYPVLLLDLSVSRKNPLTDIPALLNDMLKKSLFEYDWLHNILRDNFSAISHSKINKYDAKFFMKARDGALAEKELDDGLFRIAKFLFEYFKNHKVILLIDEYEKVALHSITSNNQNGLAFYQKLNKMLIRVLNDGSEYIKTVVITGTGSLGFSVEPTKFSFFGFSLFGSPATKRDFITHHVFLDDHPFTPYFGFLENDLIELYNLYGSEDHEKNTIEKLYNGYLTTGRNRTMVYNPSSIARFFQITHHPPTSFTYLSDAFIDPDWQLLLVPFMKSDLFREKMEEVLKLGVFQYPIKKQLPVNSLAKMLKLVDNEFKKITLEDVDMFFTIAFEQGYFSHVAGENTFSLPNRNIELILRLQFEKYFDG